jgi:hypothetical protein
VIVTRNGRHRTVMISVDEYDRLKRRDREVLGIIEAIRQSRAPSEAAAFNDERNRNVAFPSPRPGLVIRYAYLWQAKYRRGPEEGAKDRPCAVVLVHALYSPKPDA